MQGRRATPKTGSLVGTLLELGALMADVGAWQAINLDGGSSSAIHVDAAGRIVNAQSDGNERVVASHLGVAVLQYAAALEDSCVDRIVGPGDVGRFNLPLRGDALGT